MQKKQKQKAKKTKGGLLRMLYFPGSLGASLFGTLLTGKGTIRASKGTIRADESTIRAGQNF